MSRTARVPEAYVPAVYLQTQHPESWIDRKRKRPQQSLRVPHKLPNFGPLLGEQAVFGFVWTEPKPITKAIEDSRKILELQDNWDDEGAKAYKKETWDRAVEVVRRSCEEMWENFVTTMPAPRILAGPDGTIDLHWKTAKFELLVNIPEDPTDPITYYGDDYGMNTAKGTIDPNRPSHILLCWLNEHK